MMDNNLTASLENKKKYLYFSINSECLKYFKDQIISIPYDRSEESTLIQNCMEYKIILGVHYLVINSFEASGFFDEKFDSTFVFGTHYLLSKDYKVYDCAGLKKNEMYPLYNLMKKVVRRKGKYEYSNGLLVKEIDLNDCSGLLYYTKEALKNIKSVGLDKKIQKFDLIKERAESLEMYDDFDKKIQSGTLKEFEWS